MSARLMSVWGSFYKVSDVNIPTAIFTDVVKQRANVHGPLVLRQNWAITVKTNVTIVKQMSKTNGSSLIKFNEHRAT